MKNRTLIWPIQDHATNLSENLLYILIPNLQLPLISIITHEPSRAYRQTQLHSKSFPQYKFPSKIQDPINRDTLPSFNIPQGKITGCRLDLTMTPEPNRSLSLSLLLKLSHCRLVTNVRHPRDATAAPYIRLASSNYPLSISRSIWRWATLSRR